MRRPIKAASVLYRAARVSILPAALLVATLVVIPTLVRAQDDADGGLAPVPAGPLIEVDLKIKISTDL
jgi:hypothetical protein